MEEVTTFPVALNGEGAAVKFSSSPPLTAKRLKSEPAGSEDASETTTLPRQIPDSMWKKVEAEVLAFLANEIETCEQERWELLSNISRWKRAYAAPMPHAPKNFPLRNSSNLTIPVIKEIVNTLVAQLVQSTLTARPRWVFEDVDPNWEPFKDNIERFLDLASDRDLKLDSVAIDWIIEAAKLGTSVMEVGYEVDVRKQYRYTPDGKRVYPKRQTFKDGPSVNRVPLSDFYIRFHETDIQTARWCGRKLRLTPAEAKRWEKQNRLYNLDKVAKFYEPDEDEVQRTDEELSPNRSADSYQPKYYEFFSIYVSYDVDGDGYLEEIKVYFHKESMTCVGRFFHPYDHGKRPFIRLTYFPYEGRFYGEGLCEMLEQLQMGISTKHNQRSDNATMANLKMIIKRKMLDSIRPGDPLYTGKIIEANDIWNDIREFQMAEIYPSTINEEQILRNYADRLAGQSEATAGSAMPVSRTTFGAQLALLQEQAKRIDLTVRNIRSGLNETGWFVLMMYMQFGTHGKALAWMGEQGREVDAVFRLPRRVVELGLGLRLQVPTSLQNRQVKRENSIAMFNLLLQLYKEFIPVVQGMAPEALPTVIGELVSSAKHFVGDVLESFVVIDTEDALAGLAVLERILPSAEDLGGLDNFNRAEESAALLDRLSRMEDIYREADRDKERAANVSVGNERASRNPPPERGARDVNPSILIGGGNGLPR